MTRGCGSYQCPKTGLGSFRNFGAMLVRGAAETGDVGRQRGSALGVEIAYSSASSIHSEDDGVGVSLLDSLPQRQRTL